VGARGGNDAGAVLDAYVVIGLGCNHYPAIQIEHAAAVQRTNTQKNAPRLHPALPTDCKHCSTERRTILHV